MYLKFTSVDTESPFKRYNCSANITTFRNGSYLSHCLQTYHYLKVSRHDRNNFIIFEIESPLSEINVRTNVRINEKIEKNSSSIYMIVHENEEKYFV